MSKHDFKLCSLNVRSINNKTLCIREFIIDNNLDILFLCETWLGTDYDETSISEFLPPGYKLLHQARTNQRGGGVGIVYKGGLDVVKTDSSDGTTLLEYLTCKVSLHKKQFILCSMYRSPSSKNSDFLNEWNTLLSDLVILPDELMLCGDLNLYLDVPSNNNTIQFLQSLDACGLIQHVTEPTHYQGHTLDVIITRASNNYIENINVVDLVLCIPSYSPTSHKSTQLPTIQQRSPF